MQTFSKNFEPSISLTALDDVFHEFLKLPPGSLNDEMTMNDIDLWDSLRHMELIVAIEEKFGLELSFEEISTMHSIGAIRNLIASKIGI